MHIQILIRKDSNMGKGNVNIRASNEAMDLSLAELISIIQQECGALEDTLANSINAHKLSDQALMEAMIKVPIKIIAGLGTIPDNIIPGSASKN